MTFKLYAILRSYNTKRVIDLLHRLSLSTTPLDSVTVIIDIERDAINTPGLLKDITCPFPIHVIPLDHYGWSKALNTAILSLPEVDTRTDEYIMPISNEVLIESNQIQMLHRNT